MLRNIGHIKKLVRIFKRSSLQISEETSAAFKQVCGKLLQRLCVRQNQVKVFRDLLIIQVVWISTNFIELVCQKQYTTKER